MRFHRESQRSKSTLTILSFTLLPFSSTSHIASLTALRTAEATKPDENRTQNLKNPKRKIKEIKVPNRTIKDRIKGRQTPAESC